MVPQVKIKSIKNMNMDRSLKHTVVSSTICVILLMKKEKKFKKHAVTYFKWCVCGEKILEG